MTKSTILILIFSVFSNSIFAQLSLLKDINTLEEGSNPANYTEINGTVFFTTNTSGGFDGLRLWKTDGTANGTIKISEQKVVNSSFYVFNSELYYFAYDDLLQPTQLWKTDGTNLTLVKDTFGVRKLYFLNNSICFLDSQGLMKLENNASISLIKAFPSSYILLNNDPIFFNNTLIYFLYFTNQKRIQVWSSDGQSVNTTAIKTIEDSYMVEYAELKNKETVAINNKGFFFISSYDSNYYIHTDLWATDGTNLGTTLMKNVSINQDFATFYKTSYLSGFQDKILFFSNSKDLWISDGTTNGTQNLKTFQDISNSNFSSFFGHLNNKFYFTANNFNNDYELWQTDGTSTGTTLLKNLNPIKSSYPNYFITISNKLYFEANTNELWQSDGTEVGTIFLKNVPKPSSYANDVPIRFPYIYTSNNKLIFSNYDNQTDFEPWISNDFDQNPNLLKNIETTSKGSKASDVKLKVGNIWYFNGSDYRGSELWKTDGTDAGTTIVKDINIGMKGVTIKEMVNVGNQIFFTGQLTDEKNIRLWKSDGTDAGTVEININNGDNIYLANPYLLVTTNDKLYFVGYYKNAGSVVWISDGTDSGTQQLAPSKIINRTPRSLAVANNKLFFTIDDLELWVSDGTEINTKRVIDNYIDNTPLYPTKLIEFQNKLYFFSSYVEPINQCHKALFVSDGTQTGTTIIKSFNCNEVSSFPFLDKTNDKLFFSTFFSSYPSFTYDLWACDGTTSGTAKLKTFLSNQLIQYSINTARDRNLFYMSFNILGNPAKANLWCSNGTVSGTNLILQKDTPYLMTFSQGASFDNKFYFEIFDYNYGEELWSSNGTIAGTNLVSEVQSGVNSSYIGNFMNFDRKLLFLANDGVHGKELWQYSLAGQLNYTLQSGNWSSPSIWSLGRVPLQEDDVLIKLNHTIAVPENYRAFSNSLSTESGAVLDLKIGAVLKTN
jgi:trimeric autotransporter adhesin